MGENQCVFCVRSKLEERIIYENEKYYVVATLGQIKLGYTLLIPKRHVLCFGAMTKLEIEEATAMISCLDRYTAEEFHCSPIIFENGIVGQTIKHAYLHFPGKEMDIVPSLDWVRLMYSDRQTPYLFWNDCNRKSVICWNPPAPLYYFRKIIAEMLGVPERADWRAMDSGVDRRLWSETVIRLKKYF